MKMTGKRKPASLALTLIMVMAISATAADKMAYEAQIKKWRAEREAELKADDGWLTLTGRVDHQYQSDLAFDHVASLYGVLGVTNDLKVVEML